MGDIATSAFGFCEGFVAFLAKFARTLAKFARIGLRHLGQPVPAIRKAAIDCLPEMALLLLGSAPGKCALLM